MAKRSRWRFRAFQGPGLSGFGSFEVVRKGRRCLRQVADRRSPALTELPRGSRRRRRVSPSKRSSSAFERHKDKPSARCVGAGACLGTIDAPSGRGPVLVTWRTEHLPSWTAGQAPKWLQAWLWTDV
eukprot:12913659-Alexandrium_andersonii.AAC.1